jgi:predicted component of type VI protein secretion system
MTKLLECKSDSSVGDRREVTANTHRFKHVTSEVSYFVEFDVYREVIENTHIFKHVTSEVSYFCRV